MDNAQFGKGEHAALLIHGLSGSPLEMQYVAGRLRKAGFSVHVPHLAGYGFADRGKRTDVGRWQDWYRELANEFEELSRAHRTVSVCGLCIGAVLALKLAADTGARISGLSLLATTLYYDGWSIPWYRFMLTLGYYLPFGHGYAYQERYPYGVKNEQLRRWIAREMREKSTSIAGASKLSLTAIHEAEKLIGVVKRRMREVTVPALVIHALEEQCGPDEWAGGVNFTPHIGPPRGAWTQRAVRFRLHLLRPPHHQPRLCGYGSLGGPPYESRRADKQACVLAQSKDFVQCEVPDL